MGCIVPKITPTGISIGHVEECGCCWPRCRHDWRSFGGQLSRGMTFCTRGNAHRCIEFFLSICRWNGGRHTFQTITTMEIRWSHRRVIAIQSCFIHATSLRWTLIGPNNADNNKYPEQYISHCFHRAVCWCDSLISFVWHAWCWPSGIFDFHLKFQYWIDEMHKSSNRVRQSTRKCIDFFFWSVRSFVAQWTVNGHSTTIGRSNAIRVSIVPSHSLATAVEWFSHHRVKVNVW